MKKTEIRVTIDSEEKQQRAIKILERYGEPIWEDSIAMDFDDRAKYLIVQCDTLDNLWLIADLGYSHYRTEITLDELEELLKTEK